MKLWNMNIIVLFVEICFQQYVDLNVLTVTVKKPYMAIGMKICHKKKLMKK